MSFTNIRCVLRHSTFYCQVTTSFNTSRHIHGRNITTVNYKWQTIDKVRRDVRQANRERYKLCGDLYRTLNSSLEVNLFFTVVNALFWCRKFKWLPARSRWDTIREHQLRCNFTSHLFYTIDYLDTMNVHTLTTKTEDWRL